MDVCSVLGRQLLTQARGVDLHSLPRRPGDSAYAIVAAIALAALFLPGSTGAQTGKAAVSPKLTPAAPNVVDAGADPRAGKARLIAQMQVANPVGVAFLQGQRPAAPDAVATLGPDLFGDKLNLYNGSFAFEQTDVVLPGNSTLRVALDRQHTPGRQVFVQGAFSDWDLNVPRIDGTFADVEGFVPASGDANSRCSGFDKPPSVWRTTNPRARDATRTYAPDEYWQGTSLVIPGHGSQEILLRADMPGARAEWTLVTRNQWLLRCLVNLRNGPGQGFVARSPEGVDYYFDWMASRQQTALRKGDTVLGRRDVFLMATLVTDRFGNTVSYDYDPAQPMNLRQISASDGRRITLTYVNGLVNSVHDGTRTWTYQYTGAPLGELRHVVLPDQSRWTFNLRSLVQPEGESLVEATPDCDRAPTFAGLPRAGSIQHPSGAVGEFGYDYLFHGRTNVERRCTYMQGVSVLITDGSVFPNTTRSQTLQYKKISGPGLPDMLWRYSPGPNGRGNVGAWAPCSDCPDRKVVTVFEPDGGKTLHTFGIRWRDNDGQLLRLEQMDASGNVLRSTDYRYRTPVGTEFPDGFGLSPRLTTDWVSTRNRPQDRRVVRQQNVNFTWEAQAGNGQPAFDRFARPVRTLEASSIAYSRLLQRVYRDSTDLWVLGQTSSITELNTGWVLESIDYDDRLQPRARFSFGRKLAGYTYHPDGMLKDLADGADRTTTFDLYHRGQPQQAIFADGRRASQSIDNLGNPRSITNEAGTTTHIDYDAMGRVRLIVHPSEPSLSYCPTTIEFRQSQQSDRGLPAGHWRQTVGTCNDITDRWFDGLWRVRLEYRRDVAQPGLTGRAVEKRHDPAGNRVFESYPQRDLAQVDLAHPGVHETYDSLQRLVRRETASEIGMLVTRVEYLNWFIRRVTDPRGYATDYFFQVFDTPSEDVITGIELPNGDSIGIKRDVVGKPEWIRRNRPSDPASPSVTRSYQYNQHQLLCATVEPETGATLQGYDAAGNIAWRTPGQPASARCSNSPPANATAATINYVHDARNRIERTTFGDGVSPPIVRGYTSDGLIEWISSGPTVWSYSYNKRRLLTHEQLAAGGTLQSLTWGINAYGQVESVTYPFGAPVRYWPNALGQPTAITVDAALRGVPQGVGAVSDIRYHSNGSIASYMPANGVGAMSRSLLNA
jgi:YD repeat-containing protein